MISIIIPVFNTEEYLREALNAVIEQTHKDFEAIIINDGSVDGSQQIIDEFCLKDERFHGYYQENSGVSAARNNGITKATGEFLFFYDSDDIILPDTLEKLYGTAKENNADMVIGKMAAVFIGESRTVKNSRVLSKKKEISKFDRNVLYSFTVNNKLFKSDVIKKHGLRFENFDFNEDGVFTFNYIKNCNKICGCNSLVYKYRRRPYWDNNNSLTQQGTRTLMEESMTALDRIKETIDEIFIAEEKKYANAKNEEYKDFIMEKQMYYSSMYYRFLSISVINNFYRLLWRSDDDLIDYINEKYNYFKSHITSEYLLEALKKNNPDIDFSVDLPSKEEIINNPKICVIVTANISEKNADKVIKGIYNQNMPSFVVYIHEKVLCHIDDEIRDKKNLFVIPKSIKGKKLVEYVKEKCRSKYVMFMDEDVYLENDTLKNMNSILECDEITHLVTAKTLILSDEKCTNYAKVFLGNQLFRASLLEEKPFLKCLIKKDINEIYHKYTYKTTESHVFTPMGKRKTILGVLKRYR